MTQFTIWVSTGEMRLGLAEVSRHPLSLPPPPPNSPSPLPKPQQHILHRFFLHTSSHLHDILLLLLILFFPLLPLLLLLIIILSFAGLAAGQELAEQRDIQHSRLSQILTNSIQLRTENKWDEFKQGLRNAKWSDGDKSDLVLGGWLQQIGFWFCSSPLLESRGGYCSYGSTT